MAEHGDYMEMIEAQEKVLEATRWKRMDEDWGRFLLDSFVLKNWEGNAVPEAYPVTLNDPQTQALRVISVLTAAEPYPEVFGAGRSDKENVLIEELWSALVYETDRSLERRDLDPMHFTFVSDSVLRGWVASRNTVWNDNGKVRLDILPCDPRYLTWETGRDGLLWAASSRLVGRAEADRDYGYAGNAELVAIHDFHNDKVNVIYVDRKAVDERPNHYGYPPFVIKPVVLLPKRGRVTTQSMQGGALHSSGVTSEILTTHGESIYSANRHIADVKNAVATITHTLGYRAFRPPYAFTTLDGTKRLAESPYSDGAEIDLAENERIDNVLMGELRQDTSFLWGIVDPAYQRGGLVYTEWGDLPFSGMSALLVEKLETQRDQIFNPRIKTLAALYRDTFHMVIDQFANGGISAELWTSTGRKLQFSPGDLKGDFQVKFGITVVSPDKDIANLSRAGAATRFLSADTIRRDILKVPNPEEEAAKLRDDKIRAMVPEIDLFDRVRDLTQQSKEVSGDEKKALLAERELIKSKLALITAQTQAAATGNGKEPKGAEGEEGEVTLPLMSADERLDRESLRRKGVKRQVVGREGVR